MKSRWFRALAAKGVVRYRRLPEEWKRAEGLAFLTWPPVSSRAEFDTVATKVGWLLPMAEADHVWIACVKSLRSEVEWLDQTFMDRTIRVEPVFTDREFRNVLSKGSVVLLTRILDIGNLQLAGAIRRAFVIDPDAHGDLQAIEWQRLYNTFGATRYDDTLTRDSERNFEDLSFRLGRPEEVNVCGNGESLSGIVRYELSSDVNIVCNSAVTNHGLMDRLRPAVVAFLSPPLFSPGGHARRFMRDVIRCVEQYGSYVVTRAGYRHHLLARHYPNLRSRLIGLAPVPAVTYPARGRMTSFSTNNVLTGLMLPMAAGFRPQRIRVWGCDGRKPSDMGAWKYSPELGSAVSEAEMHGSYMHTLEATQASAAEYEKHCRCVEQTVASLEARGIEVVSATASSIPAFATRYASFARVENSK